MLVIRQPIEVDQIGDAAIREVVELRMAEWAGEAIDGEDLLGHFLIVEPADTMDVVRDELGFDPTENRFTGLRVGGPGYTPSFEMVERHSTFFEMVFVLGDDGMGVVVIVPDLESVPAPLLELCRQYAIPAQEASSS